MVCVCVFVVVCLDWVCWVCFVCVCVVLFFCEEVVCGVCVCRSLFVLCVFVFCCLLFSVCLFLCSGDVVCLVFLMEWWLVLIGF